MEPIVKSRTASILCTCVLVAISALARMPAWAKGANAISPEAVSQLFAARVTCDTADGKMRTAMEKASAIFYNYFKTPGMLPLTGARVHTAVSELEKLLVPNPYLKHEILAQQVHAQFPDMPARAIIVCDLTLSDNTVRHYRQFPPRDWIAPPGSIAIIHNDFDHFIVWSAGLDGQPLKKSDGTIDIIDRSTSRP